MSLLCAAGHMESSQCVWRRWQKTSTATATPTERVAAVFWFLLSPWRWPTNTRSLSRVSFSFCDFFLFLLFFNWALHTPSRLSYCPTHHTHRCWPSVCLFFRFSLFTLSSVCSLHSDTLRSLSFSLPRWRSFHSCILHISSAFLFPLYDHCVCELLSVCVCALPLSLCWLPVLLLFLASVTKISLSSFCLPYYPMLFLFLMFYLRAGMCVCVCSCERLRVSFTFAFCGYYEARWVPFLSRIISFKYCEPSLPFSLSLSASSTKANSDRILSFLYVCICK